MNWRQEIKEQLLINIEGTSAWRAQKAEEYPEDAERNLNSSEELAKLHNYINKNVTVDHPLISAINRPIDGDDATRIIEEENYLISRYGFHRGSEDPEVFISRLTELYSQAQ